MLPSAEMDDLPVVVKFILQSVGDSDAFEVRVNIALNLVGYCNNSTESQNNITGIERFSYDLEKRFR